MVLDNVPVGKADDAANWNHGDQRDELSVFLSDLRLDRRRHLCAWHLRPYNRAFDRAASLVLRQDVNVGGQSAGSEGTEDHKAEDSVAVGAFSDRHRQPDLRT
jgi:hypothetical protein